MKFDPEEAILRALNGKPQAWIEVKDFDLSQGDRFRVSLWLRWRLKSSKRGDTLRVQDQVVTRSHGQVYTRWLVAKPIETTIRAKRTRQPYLHAQGREKTTLGLDDSGIAYAFYMSIVFIVCGGLVLACVSPVINGLSGYANTRIESGTMSAQTKGAIDWNIAGFVFLPTITLIGLLLWSITRPLEQKRLGR